MNLVNKYVNNSNDLVTTYDETKIGFLNLALRKSKEASYYVNLGNAFRAVVKNYDNPEDLVSINDITVSMSEAAGISTKARGYLQHNDTKEILVDFVEEYLKPAGKGYVDELIARYMLTQGDALGGRMRNIGGKLAGEKLTQNIISILKIRNYTFSYFDKRTKKWFDGDLFRNDLSGDIKAIKWEAGTNQRLLYYDLTVPIVKKNIDIVIFNNYDVNNKKPKEFKEFIRNPQNYLSLGELKGGVDPAGADEHWKTANTALDRIRKAFSNTEHDVFTVFIGAAIEIAMAKEIYNQCTSNVLTNCANLTKSNQLLEVCDWIVTT